MRWSSIARSISGLAFVACADSAAAPTPPVGLKVTTAPSETAQTMTPLARQPVLQLVDANGSPVATAGWLVTTRVVGAGRRIVEGGSAITDASGVATFQKLTLGINDGVAGPTGLLFETTGLQSEVAQVDLACAGQLIEVGGRVTDQLTTGDCRFPPGSTTAFFKEYRLNVTAATKAIRVSHFAEFPGAMYVRGPWEPGLFIGFGCEFSCAFKAFVPPGTTTILQSAAAAGMTGRFTFDVASVPEDEPECEVAHFQSPLSTNQTLRPACTGVNGKIGDRFDFAMWIGSSVSVSVTSAAFVPKVVIRRFWPTEAEEATGTLNGNTSSVTHVNQTGGAAYYYIFVTSSDGTGTGAYAVQATISQASGSMVGLNGNVRIGAASVTGR
jgi:hypothetical protein